MNLGVWELLLIFGIVILLFGTSKMRSLGSDLGNAIKGFRSSIRDGDATLSPPAGVMQEDARSRDERPV